jgi:hypothetical protein
MFKNMKCNFSQLPLLFISLFFVLISQGCLMSAGTHGAIATYDFRYSKSIINETMKEFYQDQPIYKVPIDYYEYTWHYGGNSTTKDKWIQEANADSVSFNFYFKDLGYVVWSKFIGHSDDWYKPNCEFALVGYIKPGEGKWKFEKELSKEEKKKIETEFKSHVIDKVQNLLSKQNK